ncbi:hypothetical protein [Brevundimonas sp.]|uniref:hypothetical protein n=1 Tax=Brevundimonas sp. TaxID=1871086 RepID=UPI002CCCFD25|nr:hypothetical protein [Brevundimonas sp.]HWQ87915.1 hypothetical protein [Brevundimonas sp.]
MQVPQSTKTFCHFLIAHAYAALAIGIHEPAIYVLLAAGYLTLSCTEPYRRED